METNKMQTTIETNLNGINFEQLHEIIRNVEAQPTLGAAKFRARNKWINGGHNRSTIQGFYAAGAEDTLRQQPHVVDADEPVALLGTDHAANPAEFVLHALAACLTSSIVYHAAARGIEIEEMESRLEGDLDVRGLLGIAPDVRKGFQNIRATFSVKSNASVETLKELAEFSPIFDTIRNPVAVTLDIQKRN